ncbi:hypothetical protein BDV93DRAFT_601383 [Ceratobasidium sp. AG-I]|nr:hypothetical protein BDV93DRAFT_601383 [Ceratobasidium sp. AG-I]
MTRLPSSHRVLLIFVIRTFIALATNGFFQPDEYFQALEPAHRAVFGFGHLTWEWANEPPIRSFAFPAVFVPAYWVVKVLGLESSVILVWAPRLVQAGIASVGDVALYTLASSLTSKDHADATLFLSLISPFNALALTRTLSNSAETSLTTLALNFWPFSTARPRSHFRMALGLAALSCMLRPTGAIIWIFLGAELVWRWRRSVTRIGGLVFDVSLVGALASAAIVALDTAYYKTFTVTPLSFLKTNILSGVSHFYGINTPHYYLTQGLPIVIGPALPSALRGIWLHFRTSANGTNRPNVRALSVLVGLVVWTVGIYSCLAHKEWRFVHPLAPVLHIFAANALIEAGKSDGAKGVKPSQKLQSTPTSKESRFLNVPLPRRHVIGFLLLSLPLNLYLIFLHGSAQISATRYLHQLGQNGTRVKSVGVLMPCHSIPWQSYMHLPNLERAQPGSRLWALGCEPPLGLSGKQLETYESQTDIFFDSLGPLAYFERYFPPTVDLAFPPSPAPFTIPGRQSPERGWNHTWPTHLLLFGVLETTHSPLNASTTVKTRLEELGYTPLKRFRNGFEEDERRKGGVVLYEWTGGHRL